MREDSKTQKRLFLRIMAPQVKERRHVGRSRGCQVAGRWGKAAEWRSWQPKLPQGRGPRVQVRPAKKGAPLGTSERAIFSV